MTDLVEFLTARYNEAEKRERGRYTTTIWPADHRCAECTSPVEDIHFRASGGDAEEITLEPCGHTLTHAAYLDRYCESAADPFILADIDAKRRIIEEVVDEATCLDMQVDSEFRVGRRSQSSEPYLGDKLLRLLALPYAVHPDYEEAVRP